MALFKKKDIDVEESETDLKLSVAHNAREARNAIWIGLQYFLFDSPGSSAVRKQLKWWILAGLLGGGGYRFGGDIQKHFFGRDDRKEDRRNFNQQDTVKQQPEKRRNNH